MSKPGKLTYLNPMPRTSKNLRPAVFIGVQPGYRHLPAIELFTLLVAVADHPAGSTVSRQTLERHGYRVDDFQPPALGGHRDGFLAGHRPAHAA